MTSEPRRIAFVTDAREVWGAERSLMGLVAGARKHGWSATIVCPASSPLPAFAQERGVVVDFRLEDLPKHPGFAAGGLRSGGLKAIFSEVVSTLRAVRFVRKIAIDFDVVVSFEMWRNLEVALGCLGTQSQAVLDMHDVFEGRLGLALNRVAGRFASLSLGPSLFTLEKTGLSGRRAKVVPRGTVVVNDDPVPRERDFLLLTILGEVREYKRVDLFCEVVLECARQGVALRGLIVGDIPENELGRRLSMLVESSGGILRQVKKTSDVTPYLQQSDYVVSAAREEAFGRTLIEGLASGAVPVSFSQSGPAEIIQTAGIGYVLDDSTGQDGLVKGLIEALQDKTMRDKARLNGRNIAQVNFSWEAVTSAYYESIELVDR